MNRALLRRYAGPVGWIAFFAAVSTAAAIYILAHERLLFPWQHRYTIHVALANADAVSPGEGQPVTVAGVEVGSITGVALHDGVAILAASIDPGKLQHVYSDARATLDQRTPLKDVELNLDPGGPPAPFLSPGTDITAAQTQFPVDADQFLAGLDTDTREYLQTLLTAAGIGLRGRGADLRAAIETVARPTLGQLQRINAAFASRRQMLAELIHNLARLGASVAAENPALAQLVRSGNATVRATASQSSALGQSLAQLPPTLSTADRSLVYIRNLADTARSALTTLTPFAHQLPTALHAAQPVLDRSHPFLRDQAIPLVHSALPVAAELGPTIPRLAAVTPSLTRSFQVLDYLGNELAYEPADRHGYLFWFAWLAHNANSISSLGDSMGALARGMSIYGCHSIATNPTLETILELVSKVSIPTLCARAH